ncbi:MAG: hypothetical protein DMG00_29760, partial [Acidobacteria bacterium]
MPKVTGIPGPYWFFFYSFDCNEPIHVHVRRDRQHCKFWLAPVSLACIMGSALGNPTIFGAWLSRTNRSS